MSQGMMPEFARGWEKDGWEVDDMSSSWAKKHVGDHLIARVSPAGVYNVEDYKTEVTRIGNAGDPQTAKAKAEQLMEGL